ncbi:hypothetical protein PLICRDRAFT_177920 [Plicaturopsis crispa FD-325 SS-3]|nr:hypothetical protein PLICRDRAFT_177920 [Plicaturopsis crispa FD-325 SS-3]
MSTYKSIAIFGAGTLGKHVIQAFAAEKEASVLVVLRAGGSARTLPAGVESVTADYANSAELTKILREHKVEVVVSLVGAPGIFWQKDLGLAAKEAGVSLFVPSEFGMPTEGHTVDFIRPKDEVVEYLKSIGLPSARYYTGAFYESLPWLVALKETGKFNIIGKGETPFTTTSVSDIGGFVAYTLTHLPPSQLASATFRIQGSRTTLLDISKLLDGKYPVVHVDAISEDVLVAANRTRMQRIIEQGMASNAWVPKENKEGPEAGDSSNELWPGHVWKDLKASLADL